MRSLKTVLKVKLTLSGLMSMPHFFSYTEVLFLLDKPFKLEDDFSTQVRSSIAETKNFILKDIDAAIPLLSDKNIEQGRATPAVCAALKSRFLLFCASKLTNGGFAAQAGNSLVSFPAGQQVTLLEAARDASKAVMNGDYGHFPCW